MKRAVPVLAACAALVLVTGCGSSKSSTTSSTTTNTKTSTTAAQGGLQANGKINYAKPPASASVQSGVIPITYREITIEPDTVKAKVGSTLKWTNEDTEPCNVTSEGAGPYKFASKNLKEGDTFELKLDRPGTIHYECTQYPTTMNGTIEVVE